MPLLGKEQKRKEKVERGRKKEREKRTRRKTGGKKVEENRVYMHYERKKNVRRKWNFLRGSLAPALHVWHQGSKLLTKFKIASITCYNLALFSLPATAKPRFYGFQETRKFHQLQADFLQFPI